MLSIVTLSVSFAPLLYHSISKAFPFLFSPSPSLSQGTERILFSLAFPLHFTQHIFWREQQRHCTCFWSPETMPSVLIRLGAILKAAGTKPPSSSPHLSPPTVIPPQPAVTDSQASAGRPGKGHLTGQKHDLHHFQAWQTCSAFKKKKKRMEEKKQKGKKERVGEKAIFESRHKRTSITPGFIASRVTWISNSQTNKKLKRKNMPTTSIRIPLFGFHFVFGPVTVV